MNKFRRAGAALAATIVPLAGACSEDQANFPDQEVTTSTTTVAPTPETSLPQAAPGNIPTALLCGYHPKEGRIDPDSITPSVEVINVDGETNFLVHHRLPIGIVFAEGTSDEFKAAVESSKTSIGETVLPAGVEGVASLTYPGIDADSPLTFTLSVTPDGTAALGNIEPGDVYGERSSVSSQSVRVEQGFLVDIAAAGIAHETTDELFLQPGGSTWTDTITEEIVPDSALIQQFVANTNFASLNQPLTQAGVNAAAMVLDRELNQGCVAKAGPIATIAPR